MISIKKNLGMDGIFVRGPLNQFGIKWLTTISYRINISFRAIPERVLMPRVWFQGTVLKPTLYLWWKFDGLHGPKT